MKGTFDVDVIHAREGRRAEDQALPDIRTALRDQLGLRLDDGTDKVEILVIDHIEGP
jgi:uncharacterized protein (TIGR03435 family)